MFAIPKSLFRFLCYTMAVITPLAPSGAAYGQTGAATEESTRYILPYSAAIVSARPRQLLTSEAAQSFPIEVVQAASLKELGFDPLNIERVIFSMIPPLAGPPNYAILVQLSKRIELNDLSPKLTQHTVPARRDGQAYLRSQNPMEPSMYWVGDNSLLLAPEHSLNQLLSTNPPGPDDFAKQLAECENDDFALLVNTKVLRPFIQLGLNQAAVKIPTELESVKKIPSLVKEARLRLSISGAGPIELSLAADDESSADQIDSLIQGLVKTYQKMADTEAAKMLKSEDPVEQAMGRYITRIFPQWTEFLVPERRGERFHIYDISDENNRSSEFTNIAIVGVLVGLLLPAVQAAREAARRTASMNNIKQLLLSLLNHEASYRSFPAYASFDDNGKPLLSWRVHILPFLEEQALYEKFHLDEPWDSDHNRQLIPLMPDVYLDPSSPKYTVQDGHTHYLGVKGEGMMFDGSAQGRGIATIVDGTANTIIVVQCNDEAAVPWTKPQDFEPDQKTPLAGLANGFHPGVFLAGFVDGHVQNVSNAIDPEMFWAMLTATGGELVRP